MCILLGMEGQNDKDHLKNIKLFRIIPKKKNLQFFSKILGGPRPPLVLLIIRHCMDEQNRGQPSTRDFVQQSKL